jgi:ankyrin repeat protein
MKLLSTLFSLVIFAGWAVSLSGQDFHRLVIQEKYEEVAAELARDPRLAKMTDELGRTPLQLAAERGDFRLVNLLVNAGCPVNAVDNLKGYSALHYALLHNYTRIARFLLSRRADLNLQDNDGNFPLHIAAANGCVDAVMLLLEHRADPNCMNRYRKNPLHFVAVGPKNQAEFPFASQNEENYLEIAEILLKNGTFATLRDINNDIPATILVRYWKDEYFAREMIRILNKYKVR